MTSPGKSGGRTASPIVPRYALLACLALVVVSLGVALTPVRPPEPAEPPFSEQARSAALTETLRLLAPAPLGTGEQDFGRVHRRRVRHLPNPAVERTVRLLTSQARALLAAGPRASFGPCSLGPQPHTPAAASLPPLASAAAVCCPAPAAPLPATAAALATELADSAAQRLADAAVADGGMARLLAAVGTAQLLQASALAAAPERRPRRPPTASPAVRHLPLRIRAGRRIHPGRSAAVAVLALRPRSRVRRRAQGSRDRAASASRSRPGGGRADRSWRPSTATRWP